MYEGDEKGVKQIQVDCVVPLKTFSVFENVPLAKGSLYEIIVNWNQYALDDRVSHSRHSRHLVDMSGKLYHSTQASRGKYKVACDVEHRESWTRFL